MSLSYAGHQLELAIQSFLQGQVNTSGSYLTGSNLLFVTGYDNVDLDNTIGNGMFGGIVKISVIRDTEVPIPGAKNYEFDTEIQIIESAADVTGSMLGVNAINVMVYFGDPVQSPKNFVSGSSIINAWYCQYLDRQLLESGDLLISQYDYRITGALI